MGEHDARRRAACCFVRAVACGPRAAPTGSSWWTTAVLSRSHRRS